MTMQCKRTLQHELLEQDTAAVTGCLVLDVTMPDLNGFELQQTLIAVQQDRPIVFISGTRTFRSVSER